MSRLNEVIESQDYADQWGQGTELERIYFMLKDISTTLAMFYDKIDDINNHASPVADMLKNWRFP